jgi:hypothetical protein
MLNRRYALLGWAVWRLGKVMAKRRARAMVPSGERSIRLSAVVPALLAAGAAVWFFVRHRASKSESEREAELVG